VRQLNTCNANLQTCQTDLGACQAEPNAIFPGDGAGHGAALSYTNHGDGTVTDDNTLLMWEVKDTGSGIHGVGRAFTWNDSFTVFLDTLNNKCDGNEITPCTSNADCAGIGNGKCGHAGFRDWRIPHVKELQSLVDYGRFEPAIDPTFPGLTFGSPGTYWSSTEVAGRPSFAWGVTFDNGLVDLMGKDLGTVVRAVRGGQ